MKVYVSKLDSAFLFRAAQVMDPGLMQMYQKPAIFQGEAGNTRE
jgi:hypothetical protein